MTYYKRIPFDTIKNFRDLGGIPTIDGKLVKWGKIYRSANMDMISDIDIKKMKDFKIATIVDLRRDSEIKKYFKNIDKIKNEFHYNHVSLAKTDFGEKEIKEIIQGKVSIGQSYRELINNYEAIRDILSIIAYSDDSVVFHCQEGKDRTGIITMIIYGILNVDKIDIIADYEISSAYLGYVSEYDIKEEYSVFRITSPYNMKEAYNYIIEEYGSFDSYIDKLKLDKKLLEKLKYKMLD